VKWVVIGFLGTGAMFLVLIALVLHAVGPAVKISDKDERVTLFGGLIDIDGKKGTVKIGDSFIDGGGPRENFHGHAELSKGESVAVLFGNGRISAGTASDKDLSWDCTGRFSDGAAPGIADKEGKKILDLSEVSGLRCTVNFPKGADARLEGKNGRLEVDKPHFDLDASLSNGRVSVLPDEAVKYAFDFHVSNGKSESRPSDANPEFHLHVQVGNGKISIEERE
jgi:hypothetical protein